MKMLILGRCMATRLGAMRALQRRLNMCLRGMRHRQLVPGWPPRGVRVCDTRGAGRRGGGVQGPPGQSEGRRGTGCDAVGANALGRGTPDETRAWMPGSEAPTPIPTSGQ